MALPFEGKTVVVTGSSRGIGKVIALTFAAHGADIVVCARSEKSTYELPGTIAETAAAVEALGRRALAVRMDLTSDEDMLSMVDQTMRTFSKIDILVNNAMLVGPRPKFLGGDAELLDASYRVNLRAPFVLSQLVGAKMAERGGGTIVNISSGAARHSPPPTDPLKDTVGDMSPVYGITKAGLDRFSTAFASELLAANIAIITVVPGLTVTERMQRNPIRPNVDLSRAEKPEVTAKAVAFLVREPMQYTGQILRASEVVQQNQL